MKRPRDRGGSQDGMGPRSVCPLEAPPLRVVWERERGDSLPHRQKKRIAHRVSVDSRRSVRWCNQQLQGPGWRNKIGGGVLFVCGIGRVGCCQYGPPSRASPTTPPGMNIDDACTEKGMCSVAYSSKTHRPYTDEHTTQLYQISYHHRGPRLIDGTRSSRSLAALSPSK